MESNQSSPAPQHRLVGLRPFYDEAGITIYHADCLDCLPTTKCDVIIMDPPYGYNYASNYTCETTTAEWMNAPIHGDESVKLRNDVIQWAGNTPWACFGSWKSPRPQYVRGVLIWDKGPASGMGDLSFPWKASYEEIYINGNGWGGNRDEGVIKDRHIVTRASMGRVHPNQKPVSLMKYLLSKAPHGVVLDPFMGSGSTLVAAKEMGRRAIGIERELKYCEIAVRRLAQQTLFQVEQSNSSIEPQP
jgi:DNA modification methylase